MILFRYIILILMLTQSLSVYAENDRISISLPDKSTFVGQKWGEDTLSIYKGRLSLVNFNQLTGFFKVYNDSVFPLYTRNVNGAADTCFFYGGAFESIYVLETYSADKYTALEIAGNKFQKFSKSKLFDYNNNKWYIHTKSENYDWGCRWDSSYEHIDGLSEDFKNDTIMWYLFFAILMGLALWSMLYPLTGERKWQLKPAIALIFSTVTIIVALIAIPKWVQLQLVLLLFSLYLIPIITNLFSKRSVLVAITHLILCLSVIGGWVYYQFFHLNDSATLSDGTTVDIHWRAGTDLPKRYLIKKIISNMVPVDVADHGESYTVYASKYEFTKGELSLLNDDICGWIAFVLHDDVLDDHSFREAQVVTQMIHSLCGVQFDFFTLNEWQAATLGQPHSKHPRELSDADEGPANKFGLVNINCNAPEYTSTYYPTLKVGLQADTLIRTVNNVYVCGSAYVSDEATNLTIVNKNIRNGAVGFRFVYRPNNIGGRKFYVKGYLNNRELVNKLPQTILLMSINSKQINTFPNYESFEEYMIEHIREPKIIEAMNYDTHKIETFNVPSGLGFYDFVPIFTFEGINNEEATISL